MAAAHHIVAACPGPVDLALVDRKIRLFVVAAHTLPAVARPHFRRTKSQQAGACPPQALQVLVAGLCIAGLSALLPARHIAAVLPRTESVERGPSANGSTSRLNSPLDSPLTRRRPTQTKLHGQGEDLKGEREREGRH